MCEPVQFKAMLFKGQLYFLSEFRNTGMCPLIVTCGFLTVQELAPLISTLFKGKLYKKM